MNNDNDNSSKVTSFKYNINNKNNISDKIFDGLKSTRAAISNLNKFVTSKKEERKSVLTINKDISNQILMDNSTKEKEILTLDLPMQTSNTHKILKIQKMEDLSLSILSSDLDKHNLKTQKNYDLGLNTEVVYTKVKKSQKSMKSVPNIKLKFVSKDKQTLITKKIKNIIKKSKVVLIQRIWRSYNYIKKRQAEDKLNQFSKHIHHDTVSNLFLKTYEYIMTHRQIKLINLPRKVTTNKLILFKARIFNLLLNVIFKKIAKSKMFTYLKINDKKILFKLQIKVLSELDALLLNKYKTKLFMVLMSRQRSQKKESIKTLITTKLEEKKEDHKEAADKMIAAFANFNLNLNPDTLKDALKDTLKAYAVNKEISQQTMSVNQRLELKKLNKDKIKSARVDSPQHLHMKNPIPVLNESEYKYVPLVS